MKHLLTILAAASAVHCLSCQNLASGADEEQEIAVSAVPAEVLAAARRAVPGFAVEEACTETEDGVLVYCLEGEANDKEWEVDVAADGKVLEIEGADDEEEGEDEDDD